MKQEIDYSELYGHGEAMQILETDIERWAKIRTMSRVRFVWLRHVLRFGLFALLLILGDILIFTWDPRRAIYFAVVLPLIGYFMGTLTWRLNESRFNKGNDA